MLNPLVLHNATYPWTKLIAAFFVLVGLYLFVRSHETQAWRLAAAGFLCLAAGFLSHYSAGPYLLALAIAWSWWRREQWRCRRFWIESAGCAAGGGLLLASWFAWAISHYGRVTTFLANTSVQGLRGASPASLLAGKAANIFYTVIPYPLRHAPEVHPSLRAPAVVVRDFMFKLYQLNLVLALGSVGGLLVAWLLWQQWKKSRVNNAGLPKTFWLYFVAFCAVAGIAVDGEVNTEGIAHICLQPLIVLGLAFVAAHYPGLRRNLRRLLLAGLVVDFTLGIGLQFYIEHLDRPFDLWLVDEGQTLTVTDGYCLALNVLGKHLWGCRFVGDGPMAQPALIVALLGSLLALALVLQSRGPAAQITAGELR
jgi:4-amino-4-deoxy-L-arabinose transferase-like glycosyltransferase